MQFATSRPPADSNPLTLLFPTSSPTPNPPPKNGEAEDGQAEFDQLFPDLAPAPSHPAPAALAAAALAAYNAASAEPVVDPMPGAGLSPHEGADAGPLGGAIVEAEAGPDKPEAGPADGTARPARLAPRPARASLRGPAAFLRPMGQQAPLAPGAPAPLVGDGPVALLPAAPPPDSGDGATPAEEGLFPGIEGAADPAAQAAAPGALEAASEPRRGNGPARESSTRPLGFFTKPAAFTPPSGPSSNVPALPAVAAPDAAAGVAMAPASELPEGFGLPVAGTATTADLQAIPLTVASAAGSTIPSDAPAISAAAVVAPSSLDVASPNESKKSFVDARTESVTARRKPVGIDGAKSDSTMSDAAPLSLQHPTSGYVAGAAGMMDRSDPSVQSAPTAGLAPEPVSTAHVAVEAVLRAADQVASREQTSVDLQFSVGGVDLSVRVELHANEVRATFRTDSAELRNNLSHEWQSFASSAPEGEHKVRLAPPVFTGASPSTTNGFAGDTSSRHRDQPASRAPDQAGSLPTGRGRSPASAATLDSSVSGGPPGASPTSRHLSTLA